jgi:deoxyhypusine synthase
MSYPEPLDFSGLKTYSLFERDSKVSVSDFASPPVAGCSFADFLHSLPSQLAASDILKVADAVCDAVGNKRLVLLCMGAHVIKTGLNPVVITLMQEGIISGVAVNGACIIHDTETAMAGKTSEDVAAVLGEGRFGAARETGEFLNGVIRRAADTGRGLGREVGSALLEAGFPYNDYSLLANAARLEIPVTVHVAVGTDIIHIHPGADGAAIGKATFDDFRIFCSTSMRPYQKVIPKENMW